MSDIKDSIMILAETYGKDYVQVIFAEVQSVNESERTCTVKQVSGDAETEIPDVKLLAESNDGFLRIPVVGSVVSVAATRNNEPFVWMFSECDKIYSIQNEFQFNDGSFGGLVKVEEITNKLNSIENKINDLITVFTSWTPVANDGGAALKTALSTWIASYLTNTQVSDIENDKITHG